MRKTSLILAPGRGRRRRPDRGGGRRPPASAGASLRLRGGARDPAGQARQGPRRSAQDRPGPFWVGYSIDRLQGERSHIGSFSDGDRDRGLTIADILAGRTAAASSDCHGGGRPESGDGRPRQDRQPGQAGEEGPQGARLLPEIQAGEAAGPRRRPDEQPRAALRLRGRPALLARQGGRGPEHGRSSPPSTAATPARRSAKT